VGDRLYKRKNIHKRYDDVIVGYCGTHKCKLIIRPALNICVNLLKLCVWSAVRFPENLRDGLQNIRVSLLLPHVHCIITLPYVWPSSCATCRRTPEARKRARRIDR
jgi:hypothetical protein